MPRLKRKIPIADRDQAVPVAGALAMVQWEWIKNGQSTLALLACEPLLPAS
jgi:hypothetical protein